MQEARLWQHQASMGRRLLVIGSLFRLAVGIGYLFAPDTMARRGFAPDIRAHANGRMITRGFGALHVGVAAGTLQAAARDTGCREVALVNLVCALGDTTATLLERRARGDWDATVAGSVPVDVLDIAWWTNSLRYL